MIRFQFVDDNLADYSVKRMCTVLGLNRSSYYKWKNSAPRRRARLVDDAVVAAEIQAIFDAENGVWGARRITAELNDRKRDNGTTPPAKRINRKRVAPRTCSDFKRSAGSRPLRVTKAGACSQTW